jgi:Bacterial SH3 domain
MRNLNAMCVGSGGLVLALTMLAGSAHAGCTSNLSAERELNIRSGPATSYDPVGRIPGDACGIRIRSCDDGWCRISYRGTEGYSSEFYLRRTENRERAGRRGDDNGFEKWLDVAGEIFAKLSRDPDWERIGALEVGRDRDRDVIQLDRRDGRFDALRMRVRGAPVDIRRVVVVYGNGKRDRLDFDRTIRRNGETGELALRGNNGRFIDRIILVHQKARRAGRPSEVEIWGRKSSDGRRRGPQAGLGPDWERLGAKSVDRKRDRDVIRLSRRDGRFDALRLAADRNDVRIRRVAVKYGNGSQHEVEVDRRIRNGELSDVIELRGKRGRFIDQVVLVYETVGRGPRARVEVWGRETRG